MRINNIGARFLMLLTGLLLLFNSQLKAQKFHTGINYLQGFHYNSHWSFFKGGTELSASLLFPGELISFGAGIDLRTVQWGNQISAAVSLNRVLSNESEAVFELQNGLALFHGNSLYTLGLGLKANYIFIKKTKVQAGISAGLRFLSCPGYADYSVIYNLWEIPAGIFFRF